MNTETIIQLGLKLVGLLEQHGITDQDKQSSLMKGIVNIAQAASASQQSENGDSKNEENDTNNEETKTS